VVHCVDVLDGPPTPWVPPRVSPSPIPPSSKQKLPTSLWKGEGQMQWHLGFSVSGGVCISPTSRKRGKGPLSGVFGMWLRAEWSGDDEEGVGETEQTLMFQL